MRTIRRRPASGQESVWDYPRPPLAQPTSKHVEVVFGGQKVVDTTRALRVLETSHPPVYYVPLEDVLSATLEPSGRATYCEFKGEARYYHLTVGEHTAQYAAWSYAAPSPGYEELLGHVAFDPRLMDECRVDGEKVRPQPGLLYGGWVTSDVVGPFKGEAGTNSF
ncbi:MAG: DUF427 domain-containing protein [Coriobacteriia bacterium]|nr:DUF427 domain-containing protein [Coriobacteriia bacterium]